jgi:hypothetical protein
MGNFAIHLRIDFTFQCTVKESCVNDPFHQKNVSYRVLLNDFQDHLTIHHLNILGLHRNLSIQIFYISL